MPATPQEGDGERQLGTVEVIPESYSIDIREWTDGQHTVVITFTSKTARYRIAMGLGGFYALLNDGLKAVIGLVTDMKRGR